MWWELTVWHSQPKEGGMARSRLPREQFHHISGGNRLYQSNTGRWSQSKDQSTYQSQANQQQVNKLNITINSTGEWSQRKKVRHLNQHASQLDKRPSVLMAWWVSVYANEEVKNRINSFLQGHRLICISRKPPPPWTQNHISEKGFEKTGAFKKVIIQISTAYTHTHLHTHVNTLNKLM